MPRRTSTVTMLHPATTPALPDTAVADGYHPAIDIDVIDPNPKNVRRDLGDLAELTASILAVGVRHPVTVTPVGAGHPTTGVRYLLVDGHRRYAAARDAGLTTIPAIVRTDLDSDVDVLTEMLRAGIMQQQLTPIEEATAYAQLELLGLKAGEIARRVGRHRSTVEQRLHLMDLPEEIRDRVHTRAITLEEAAVIAEFADLTDWPPAKTWVRELEKAAGTPDWRFALSRARQAWDGEEKRREGRALAARIGYRIVTERDVQEAWRKDVRPDWYTEEELAAAGTDPGNDRNDITAAVLAHSRCIDAAALVTPGGYVRWLCLRPEQHGAETTTDGDVVDEQLGAPSTVAAAPYVETVPHVVHAQLLQRWTEHEDPSCLAAAAARQTWIRDVLLAGRKALTGPQSIALARYLAGLCASSSVELDMARWLEWLHPDDDTLADLDIAAAEERLTTELSAHRDPQRALLAGLASEAEASYGAAAVRAWVRTAGPHRDLRAWLHLLQALGYEPCSWEAQYLAEPTGTCRVCGCTEDAACTDDPLSACWWVVPDLCSSCARKSLAAAAEEAGADG